MQAIITDKLRAIAQEHGIRMLYACESGSRGWGFPSPDSDYDVRFIYIRPVRAYLSIAAADDHLSFPISDELDIYGWDLRKVLRLMRKSNTTPFEWLQSPVVYGEEAGFRQQLWDLCAGCFNRRGNAYHYLSIAKGAWSTVNEAGEIKIKKLFYVLRPLLSAKWCLERNSIAPMTIGPLMDLLPDDMRRMVADLIRQKEGAAEGFLIPVEERLKNYVLTQMEQCAEEAKALPKEPFPLAPLDDFFLQTIRQHDDTGPER